MKNISFNKWLLEMANYGFGDTNDVKIQGGTEIIQQDVFFPIKTNEIINELCNFSKLGNFEAKKKFEHIVEWGEGFGSLQVLITPQGSSRLITRQKIYDLEGNKEWITRDVKELSDNRRTGSEITIAHNVFEHLQQISNELVPVANKNFLNFDKLSRKMWEELKIKYPSYCMFPYELKKINENYHMMIYEFKGQGAYKQNPVGTRAEKYQIHLKYEKDKGLISCMGNDVISDFSYRSWGIDQSDFIEYFSPNQKFGEIINCITTTILQY